jgi:hypothetical protein
MKKAPGRKAGRFSRSAESMAGICEGDEAILDLDVDRSEILEDDAARDVGALLRQDGSP